MANRHKDFDELVASQFEDLDFAVAYISNLINEEELSLEEALRETIVSMGLKAFADRAGISIQYVSDFVKKRRNLSTNAIAKYLHRAFNLKVRISVEPDAAWFSFHKNS